MRTYKRWSASRYRPPLRRRFPDRGGYSRRRPQLSRSLISSGPSRPRATSSAMDPRRFRLSFQPNPEPPGLAWGQRYGPRFRNHVPHCRNRFLAALIPAIEGIRVEQMADFR